MAGRYSYNLHDTVEVDISEDQSKELLESGYIFNTEAGTYDKYEEKYKQVPYIAFEYIEEKEMEVPVLDIEIYETRKVKNVSYKKKEKGIFGFFKNIAQKFFPRKEMNVSQERIQELEIMISKGEIFELEIQEKIESGRVIKKVTRKEMMKIVTPYTFLKETQEKKLEKQEIIHSEECSIEEFQTNYSEKEILSEERFNKKILQEKIVVDRRKIMTITQVFYIPGIWSMTYNHTNGTKASFNGRVEIKYISGFNPYDSQYLDVEEVKEDVIKIIEDEHFNAQYIRGRYDDKDGFNIEETRVS